MECKVVYADEKLRKKSLLRDKKLYIIGGPRGVGRVIAKKIFYNFFKDLYKTLYMGQTSTFSNSGYNKIAL